MALAKGLAEHGADVALVARTREQLDEVVKTIQSGTGRKAWAFPYDLNDVEGVASLFEQIVAATGRVDALVNAAGAAIRQPSDSADLESWNRLLRVNLTAAFAMSQALCNHCRDLGKPGRIINIGSLMCHAARPTTAAYAASKMGLVGLTKTLAVEWAQYKINVNILAPGYVATDLTAPLQADKQFSDWVVSKTPLGRWQQPEDLVGMAVLLASKAGEFVSGQVFYVDGGWTAQL